MRPVSGPGHRRRITAAIRRPAAPGATPPRRRDWILVGIAAVAAVAETVVRPGLPWPVASALVTALCFAALPWRRTHPLLVLCGVVTPGTALEVTQALSGVTPPGMLAATIGVLAPYALFRWGSGRAILVGAPLVTAAVVVSVLAGDGGVDDAIGGGTFLALVALLAEVVRQRSAARQRELERVRAHERELIARDLHDTVAHHLSAVAVRAQAGQVVAAAEPGNQEAAVEALRLVEAEARRALTEMRSLVGVLRNERPQDVAPEIDRLRSLADPGPPPVEVRISADVGPLPAATRTALFRIAQESVANARRHARDATRVVVGLRRREDGVVLTVHDDGAVPATLRGPGHGPAPEPGYGLTGMRERARALGGTLLAGPGDESGWTVRAALPAPRPPDGVRAPAGGTALPGDSPGVPEPGHPASADDEPGHDTLGAR